MTKIEITIPGERITKEITTFVPRVTTPSSAKPPSIGLVELSQTQPTELIAGPIGPQGPRGSRWYTGDGPPVVSGNELLGDMYLNDTDDSIWTWNGTAWVETGTNIHGSPDTGSDILTKIKTVDGAGSGLDADLLDGQHGAYYATDSDMTAAEGRLTAVETKNTAQDTRLTNVEAVNTSQASAITSLQGADAAFADQQTTQDNRLNAVEAKNASQDTAINLRLTDAPNDTNAYGRKAAAWIDVAEEAPADGITYGRKNGAWVASIGGATVSDTPPSPPLVQGQLWFESDTGNTYVWYVDANTAQWVQVNIQPPQIAPVLSGIVKTYITSSQTYTKPAGLKFLEVEVLGGGGGGGGVTATTSGQVSASAGGGAGGWCTKFYAADDVPASVAMTIGAGGVGPTGASGAAGGNSGFPPQAVGGGTGGSSVTAASGTLTNAFGGAGGTATGGDFNLPGLNADASTANITSVGIHYKAASAGTRYGNASAAIFGSVSAVGGNAVGYGSGGSGGFQGPSQAANKGGNGGPGLIVLTEYF